PAPPAGGPPSAPSVPAADAAPSSPFPPRAAPPPLADRPYRLVERQSLVLEVRVARPPVTLDLDHAGGDVDPAQDVDREVLPAPVDEVDRPVAEDTLEDGLYHGPGAVRPVLVAMEGDSDGDADMRRG
ncbi:hypothetical protein THAOC_33277, partial [Thalassiosira oceanica]